MRELANKWPAHQDSFSYAEFMHGKTSDPLSHTNNRLRQLQERNEELERILRERDQEIAQLKKAAQQSTV
jgi:predicted RNase H-like nuclease (RuvC/YqgF family)